MWGRAPAPVLAERSSALLLVPTQSVELRSTRTGEGARPHVASGGFHTTLVPHASLFLLDHLIKLSTKLWGTHSKPRFCLPR